MASVQLKNWIIYCFMQEYGDFMSKITRGELANSCLHHYLNIKLIEKIDCLIDDSHYTSRYSESCLLGLKQELMDSVETFESWFDRDIDER